MKAGDRVTDSGGRGLKGTVVRTTRTTVHDETGIDVYVKWDNRADRESLPDGDGPYEPCELVQL